MAYADQQMSSSKAVSIVLVILIHIGLGYALVTGLAYNAVRKVVTQLDVIDIQEEEEVIEEPEEPPPPPPDKPIEPPPVTLPPPKVDLPPPPAAPVFVPEPPPPPPQRANPEPRNNPGRWATTNDYPSRALREDREGTTRFRVTVNAKGRVESCQVTASSGHADLDAATCKNISRRARFRPSLDSQGNPTTGTYSNRVRWQIPK